MMVSNGYLVLDEIVQHLQKEEDQVMVGRRWLVHWLPGIGSDCSASPEGRRPGDGWKERTTGTME